MKFRARRAIAASSCAILVASGTTSCFADPSVLPAVRDFLIAWKVGNFQAAAGHTVGADRAEVAAALEAVSEQLDAASVGLALGVPSDSGEQPEAIKKSGETADARFTVEVDLGENGKPWTYTGLMHLRRIDGHWKVQWDPSIIHPELRKGERLAVVTEVPERAPIQDAAGRSLLRKVPAEIVGVYPGQLSDPAKTLGRFAEVIKSSGGGRVLDSERLLGRVRSAPPNEYLPLLTLQRSGNGKLIQRLRKIPGLRSRTAQLPIAPELASHLVGELGAATAERLQMVGAPYQPGDTIGISGLQLLQQRRLAGTPTVRVVAQDPAGTRRRQLRPWPGQPPQPVRTTIDRSIQRDAERTLRGLGSTASLVAVRPSTGEVVAVANHRTKGENLALEGRYPPGLTFGIVSASALLNSGLSADTATRCDPTAAVGGRTFQNPNRARGEAPLQMNFAHNCTTTLASLSSRLKPGALVAEADRLGLGKNWGTTVPAFSGVIPKPKNAAEKAALAIGQGGVQVSPLAMAMVAGAVENGTWRPPYLLNEPRNRRQGVAPQPLNPVPTSDMKKLMRRSVQSGAARAADRARGPAVSGVAATVDKDGRPVNWFVGSQGDLAFAIVVEGKVNAANVAARFLR